MRAEIWYVWLQMCTGQWLSLLELTDRPNLHLMLWQIHPGGRNVRSLSVQFLWISCRFREKYCQIIGFLPQFRGWCPLAWEILDPPLSWTVQILCIGFHCPRPGACHKDSPGWSDEPEVAKVKSSHCWSSWSDLKESQSSESNAVYWSLVNWPH